MCFTVQLSRSVPFPEPFVPASATTRSFYHNVLRLSRTFFKSFFGFCSSSDRSFLIFPGTPGTEACRFLTSRHQRTFIFYLSFLTLSRTFWNKFSGFSPELCWIIFNKRRRRDLNPRAAINDLLPFQGSPFSQLGYFSTFAWIILCIQLFRKDFQITERVGFEPTRPFGQTVFKTASLWPLRYLSMHEFKPRQRRNPSFLFLHNKYLAWRQWIL